MKRLRLLSLLVVVPYAFGESLFAESKTPSLGYTGAPDRSRRPELQHLPYWQSGQRSVRVAPSDRERLRPERPAIDPHRRAECRWRPSVGLPDHDSRAKRSDAIVRDVRDPELPWRHGAGRVRRRIAISDRQVPATASIAAICRAFERPDAGRLAPRTSLMCRGRRPSKRSAGWRCTSPPWPRMETAPTKATSSTRSRKTLNNVGSLHPGGNAGVSKSGERCVVRTGVLVRVDGIDLRIGISDFGASANRRPG